jgi:hypothetical protein
MLRYLRSNYLFECECAKCVSQEQNPDDSDGCDDCTDDETEDDDASENGMP